MQKDERSMRYRGEIHSDGSFHLWPDDESGIAKVVTILILIVCAGLSLLTILDHGISFVRYILSNYLYYILLVCTMIINVCLDYNNVSFKKLLKLEAIIWSLIYLFMGVTAYQVYGEWTKMNMILETICSFVGLIYMSVLSGVLTVLVFRGVLGLKHGLMRKEEDIAQGIQKEPQKISIVESNISTVVMEQSKTTVYDYVKGYTDVRGTYYPKMGDEWRCSFCNKWNPMNDKYCQQCELLWKNTDVVRIHKR